MLFQLDKGKINLSDYGQAMKINIDENITTNYWFL